MLGAFCLWWIHLFPYFPARYQQVGQLIVGQFIMRYWLILDIIVYSPINQPIPISGIGGARLSSSHHLFSVRLQCWATSCIAGRFCSCVNHNLVWWIMLFENTYSTTIHVIPNMQRIFLTYLDSGWQRWWPTRNTIHQRLARWKWWIAGS